MPAEFGQVFKRGRLYGSTADIPARKPTVDFTYYCSPTGSAVNSPTNDNPADPITPRRFVTLANAHGGNVRARCASGKYYGNIGFDGNGLSCAGVICEPWVGQQSAWPGYPLMIKRATNLAEVWNFDQGTTYWITHAIANTPVYDFKYLDKFGHPLRHSTAADLAGVRATPGSEFLDVGASRKYVTAIDGRNLVGDTMMMVPTNGNNLSAVRTDNQTVWLDGIGFIGHVLVTQATAAKQSWFYAQNCKFFGNVSSNCLSLIGPVIGVARNPIGGGAGSDTWSVTGNGVGDAKLLLIDDASIRSGYDAAGTNNIWTGHNNCIMVAINSKAARAQNRQLHFVNAAKGWFIGAEIFGSDAVDATGISVVAGNADAETAQLFLHDCLVRQSANAGIHAYSGCAVNVAEMGIDGLTKTGSGTLARYIASYD